MTISQKGSYEGGNTNGLDMVTASLFHGIFEMIRKGREANIPRIR